MRAVPKDKPAKGCYQFAVSWLSRHPNKTWALRVKRAVDVAAAGAGLVVLAPLVAGVTGVVAIKHGWPPFFVQRRPGFRGREFKMVKLRTMSNARGPDGKLLPDSERLTPLGRALRSTSMDELPELWNVLVGDMSLVGPRPLLVEYMERYTEDQHRRHEMPPGITGLTAVRGRNAISWDEKFSYDLQYVDDWSLGLDATILWETVLTVLKRDGVNAEADVPMPEFVGRGDA